MSEPTPEVVVEETPATESRFNVRRAAKAAAITAGVVTGFVLLKRKLNADVDGEVTATVTTNSQD